MNKQDKDSLTDLIMTAVFITLVIFVVKARDTQRVLPDREVPVVEQEQTEATGEN